MRVFVPLFVFYASIASAAPDCQERTYGQPRETELYELPTEQDVDSKEETVAAIPERDLINSPRPQLRPCKFRQFEIGRKMMRERGAVCGDWTIIGENRKPFSGRRRGCGIAEPVRIRIVSDVYLSQLALLDCKTAVTLKTWLENTAKPAFADRGGGLKGLRLSGHYACKTQNNQPDARLSAHARGHAIDISSFILMDGTIISVSDGWASKATSAVLRELHAGACGLFSTVLGPDSDRYHKGHFHFDTTRRRNGPYCR